MTSPKPQPPEAADEQQRKSPPASEERGTNEVEHEPDPSADHTAETDHYVKRSPYTTGNY